MIDRMPFSWIPVGVLTAGSVALMVPSAGHAQTRSLTWTETTEVEVPGALGTLLNLTGATRPNVSRRAMHVQGRTMIQEDDQTASVIDLDNGRMLMIDHDGRSYITFTFEEMAQVSSDAMQSARPAVATDDPELSAEREELNRTIEEAQATLNVRVRAESTGRRQDFGSGINAMQHFVITDFEATAVPEGMDQPEGGSMYFLAELWKTTDAPSPEALLESWAREMADDPRFQAMADERMESMRASDESLALTLATWDPQVAAGLQRAAEASREMDGTTVRSTTTIALVPLGMEVDREALLAWEPASVGQQLGGAAAGAARQAAADAARSAVRGLFGGRGGGDATPPPANEAASPRVSPFMRITTSKEDLAYRESGEDALAALQARIADYRGQTMAELMGGLQEQRR